MSTVEFFGARRHRLVLLAIDFSLVESDSILTECVDAWGEFELLEDVYIVDLSAEEGQPFPCSLAGEDRILHLEKVLLEKIWSDITVISVRATPLSRIVAARVDREERLQSELESAFPTGSACKTTFFTMSWTSGEEFYSTSLPRNFTSNFLHDRDTFLGGGLARAPFNAQSRHLSLVFNALIGAGGFTGQVDVPFQKVSEHDAGINVGQVIRPVRAIGRAASGGWFLRDLLRRAMLHDDFYLPSGVLNPKPDSGSLIIIDDLVKETSKLCGFNYELLVMEDMKPRRHVSLFGGLVLLLKDLPKYFRRAAREVVSAEVAKEIEKYADALQQVYGENSIIRIQGTSETSAANNSEILGLLRLLEMASADFRDLSAPDPKIWKNFSLIVTGSLDGSDLPEDIRSLSRGGRTIFTNPQIVAPSPNTSIFKLSDAEKELLGVSRMNSFREPDSLDRGSQENFRAICQEVKLRQFSIRIAEQTVANSDLGERTRIRGPRASSQQKLAPDKSGSIGTLRDARTILDDFEKWLPRAIEDSSKTFMAKVAKVIDDAMEAAKLDVKVSELKKLIQDQANLNAKKASKKFPLIVTGVGAFGLISAVVVKALGWISFALTPVILIWLAVWLVGSSIAIIARIFKVALDARRRDLAGRTETDIQKLFKSTKHAMREYIRLSARRQEFYAWSRILREVIHRPYGDTQDSAAGGDELTKLPHPRQFSISKVSPSDKQMMFLLRETQRMVLVKGYLHNVLTGVISDWKDNYRQLVDDGANFDPFNDSFTTWGQPIGKHLNNESCFYPLQDFHNEISYRDLREKTSKALQSNIVSKFKEYKVREIFSQTTHNDPDHKAMQHLTPDDYLFGFLADPSTMHEEFSADLFSIETQNALSLRQNNVESSKCTMWDPDQRTLGSFNLRASRRFVMFTFLCTVGKKAGLVDIKGFRSLPNENPDSGNSPLINT